MSDVLRLEDLEPPKSQGNPNGGPGRPVGIKNGEGKGLAPIKKWSITHESIVHLHMANWSNEQIARFLSKKGGKKISATRVSQVLQDPHAARIIEATKLQMKERMKEDIVEGLTVLAEKSVKRLEETLEAEFTVGSDAKKHQDNVALSLTKNFLPGSNENLQRESGVPVGVITKLFDAMKKSNEAEDYQRKLREKNEIIIAEAVPA